LKNIKKEQESVKNDYKTIEKRLWILEDENNAKTKYFEWINEAVIQGSNS